MAKAVTIYGIKNCDTMKKARAWLDQRGVAYEFHDYKAAGIERGLLEAWARELGWETLLNRAGTTFRKAAGEGQGRDHGKEGDRADVRPAFDDQAARARRRRPAVRRLPTGAIREGVRRAALTTH